jgi:hypothetical protein
VHDSEDAPPTNASGGGQRTVAWIALLVAGQGASLALIAAGNRVGYQHYQFVSRGALTWIAVSILVLQGVAVGAGIRPFLAALSGWMRSQATTLRWVLLFVALFVVSATVSRDPADWGLELVVAASIQLVAIGNAILIARSLDGPRAVARLDRWFGPPDPASPRRVAIDRFALFCALWVTVAGALLAVFSYQRHPHVPDEVVYLIHARYFAEGLLWLPAPPAPDAFNIDLMHYEATRWYSPVPPGWPLVLAAGAWAGVPWLVNPILAGCNTLLAFAVLSSMYDRRTARLATLLLALSPWFVFMSMNFMTHQATLFFALLAAVAVAYIRTGSGDVRGRSAWLTATAAAAGGLAIGVVSLIRPLDGLATALLLGIWSLPPRWWKALTELRVAAFVPSAALAIGAIVGGGLVRPYNALMTGNPSYFPIMAYIDKYYTPGSNDLGFGPNRGLGWSGLDPFPGHGPADVVVNANLNITAINIELLGWATGSLLAIMLLFVVGRRLRADWSHVAVLLTIAGVHTFYWFSGGPDFGARYWFLVIVSCAALAARGIVELGDAVGAGAKRTTPMDTRPARVLAAALALSFCALVTFFPWRAVDKYYHYRNMRPDIREIARARNLGRSLVFIRGARHPDYASAAIYNPLDLRADVPLYVWDASERAREQAFAAYPDRPVWIIDGPTRTKDGFQVAAGPLTRDAARRALAGP